MIVELNEKEYKVLKKILEESKILNEWTDESYKQWVSKTLMKEFDGLYSKESCDEIVEIPEVANLINNGIEEGTPPSVIAHFVAENIMNGDIEI